MAGRYRSDQPGPATGDLVLPGAHGARGGVDGSLVFLRVILILLDSLIA